MSIDVRSDVRVYERDGEEVGMKIGEDQPRVIVRSHWNHEEWVVIEVPGAKPITVAARAIKAAIQNATNSARFS